MLEGGVRVKKAAKHFDVTERTIRRWIEEGKIKAEKTPGGGEWRVDLTSKVSGPAPAEPVMVGEVPRRRVRSAGIQV